MVAQADRMPDVLAPVRHQIVGGEVVEHRVVDVRAGHAGPQRSERGFLCGEHVREEPAHLFGRRADHHRPLELGVVAPHRGARLGDEDVAELELDVVRDRVRPGAAAADLAAIARRRAVRRALLAAEPRPELGEHREGRLVTGAQARLGLGRARARE